MTSDNTREVVERLRNTSAFKDPVPSMNAMLEAADLIETLTADNARLREALHRARPFCASFDDPINAIIDAALKGAAQ